MAGYRTYKLKRRVRYPIKSREDIHTRECRKKRGHSRPEAAPSLLENISKRHFPWPVRFLWASGARSILGLVVGFPVITEMVGVGWYFGVILPGLNRVDVVIARARAEILKMQ